MAFFRALVLFFSLAFSYVAAAQRCNADNVLRALRRGGEPANSLCWSLILFGVPTVTVVPPPGATTKPVEVTSTSTIVRSVYPNGRTLEELSFPTFVSSYPASRVSSACSCFLGPAPTTTITSDGPTITQTKITTVLSTLRGPCATDSRTYEGAYGFLPRPTQTVINNRVSLSNAYACCNSCQVYHSANANGFCLAYYNVPGETCNLLTVNRDPRVGCADVRNDDVSFRVDVAKYPNLLGGAGPCADGVEVVRG